jgi:hypothetical protein
VRQQLVAKEGAHNVGARPFVACWGRGAGEAQLKRETLVIVRGKPTARRLDARKSLVDMLLHGAKFLLP